MPTHFETCSNRYENIEDPSNDDGCALKSHSTVHFLLRYSRHELLIIWVSWSNWANISGDVIKIGTQTPSVFSHSLRAHWQFEHTNAQFQLRSLKRNIDWTMCTSICWLLSICCEKSVYLKRISFPHKRGVDERKKNKAACSSLPKMMQTITRIYNTGFMFDFFLLFRRLLIQWFRKSISISKQTVKINKRSQYINIWIGIHWIAGNLILLTRIQWIRS